MNPFNFSNFNQIKSSLLNPDPQILNYIHRTLQNAIFFRRSMSKPTSIPKNQQRVRDHGFDNYMEIEKKIRKVLKFEDLILTQPHQSVAVSRLDTLGRRIGFKQHESGKFVLKFPFIFEIYEHPVQRILYLRLTRDALLQIEEEKHAIVMEIPNSVTRLRKLLMLSNTGRLQLEHVRMARRDFGFPDDFELCIVLKYPQYFRLYDAKDSMGKYIEIVDKEPGLAVCSVEKVREMEYRRKSIDEESTRFSFVVNFPPGFKTGKYFKIAMWKWQRLPYWSPYEDISGYDMRSLEAQNRMDKRAVAMIHELLSLTVEKKITLERIAHFRITMDLPIKLKDFLLRHQGIFYISTRGNYGKLHTVFLREAYRKGELIEPNDVYLARRRLAELILLSPRQTRLDPQVVGYRRNEQPDYHHYREPNNYAIASENVGGDDKVIEEDSDAELDDDDDDADLDHTV